MTNLRHQQHRIQQLGRRAKWFTALAIVIPAALIAGGAVLGGVALTSSGRTAPVMFCATGLLVVVSAVTFLLLREQAQKALDEAVLIRRIRTEALAPTNAGQPTRPTPATYIPAAHTASA